MTIVNTSDLEELPGTDYEEHEPSIIHIDPDFSMPAPGERGNSYLRALRILFPKGS